MAHLLNVNESIRDQVSRNAIASELSNALDGLFTIEGCRRHEVNDWKYTVLHCKPTRNTADALLLDREVLALIVNASDLQVRTLHVAQDLISNSNGRLDPAFVMVLHADKSGDEKLRNWGRELGYKVIPIHRPKAGALPPAESLRLTLAQDLFTHDPFSLTGPVLADSEFFGRRNSALDILRQTQTGRIISLFGIRKIGKTSLINRVVTLAREAGTPNIAMIDCSVDGFNILSASDALKAIAKVAKMASTRSYAHITEALKRSDKDLVPVFDDLWSTKSPKPLTLIFDEVDYITPASPNRPHWRQDFNIFWREFRVVYQEAQRMGFPISILVSGVSSHAFRVESFDEIENAVLHFVPEGYLTPFARHASKQMIKDLCKRCGLVLSNDDQDRVAETCGDFPYWIRLAGSYIHRSIDIQGRPRSVDSTLISRLLSEFVDAEGGDAARVALEDLRRKTAEPIELLQRAASVPYISLSEGKLLLRYGLATQVPSGVTVTSAMIRAGLAGLSSSVPAIQLPKAASPLAEQLSLPSEEWAEELSVINRRRNLVERKLREFIHFTLKLTAQSGENWVDKVLKSLNERQRTELSSLAGDALLNRLYWKDLGAIIVKHWSNFEKILGDKSRFATAMDLLNDRPDAHAKQIDAADVALYRRELTWLEERLA
ncbi:AAA+ ATPase superfamily predicted ATPase [Acidovorax sp. 93]|uniref:ATP-binding protein n=1 Tax=Acidovorax sp. 93 TaxID=2135632 RepID=UPI000F1B919D|nr:ATP-binding protein [Acidovorax sp. 93]RKR28000.1 AAA+ ATPase superfamily predicted ATPase [Acidovorax sp. 93]